MLGLFSGTDRPEAKCMQMSTTVKSISLSAQVSVIDGVELERESWHCSPTFKSQNSRKLSANILWCEFTHCHFQAALDGIPWHSMWHRSQMVHALLVSARDWRNHVKPSRDRHVCKYALVRRFQAGALMQTIIFFVLSWSTRWINHPAVIAVQSGEKLSHGA